MPALGLWLTLAQGPLTAARGEIAPAQVVVVANAGSPDSLRVAQHYAARRGIPSQQIAKLVLPFEESMSREEYERELVGPLRRFLQQQGIQRSIRVVVTVYGVPLRVAAPSLSEEERRWRLDAKTRLTVARAELTEVDRQSREIAPGARSKEHPAEKTDSGQREIERNLSFLDAVDRSMQELTARIKALDPSDRQRWYGRVEPVIRSYQGTAGITQLRRELPQSDKPLDASAVSEQTKIRALHSEGLQLLLGAQELPIRRDRESFYRQVQRVYGAYGVFALATLELNRLAIEDADAGVDSELSMLWWDRLQYDTGWRQANPLYHAFRKTVSLSHRDIPVLMVGRLDAPTPDLALKLVDRAMEAEQKGLSGSVYLDARGLSVKEASDTYGRYDQSLRDLAEYLKRHTPYPPVLENTEARFQRPGDAPDVALYIGWYRLRHYEDAFTFRTGAVGYHMASAEGISVRRSSETGWCKNALERGITATIGSVAEPYLDAFPEPLEFVALLSTGQYSLVEAYYLTNRWVSWRMVLFGDPLYNPWKRKPAASRSALSMFTLAPVAPSDRPFEDPVVAREERRQVLERARVKLDFILRYSNSEQAGPVAS